MSEGAASQGDPSAAQLEAAESPVSDPVSDWADLSCRSSAGNGGHSQTSRSSVLLSLWAGRSRRGKSTALT